MTATDKCVAVYRVYDIDGGLLYIGASVDPDVRMRTHRNTSAWWHLHSWFEERWFPSAREAAAAERRAILEENPRFNKLPGGYSLTRTAATPAVLAGPLPPIMGAIADKRAERRRVQKQIAAENALVTELVQQAFAEGHKWEEIAKAADVSKARVYQLRDGRR